jgi:hypothetical protein
MVARIAAFCCSFSASVIGLSMKPGATQLTVIPAVANFLRQGLGKPDHSGLRGA